MRFDGTVTLGNLLTALTIMGGLAYGYTEIMVKLTRLEITVENTHLRLDRLDRRVKELEEKSK